MKSLQDIRNLFPIFQTKVNGKKLIYFDNGATTQKPISVINSIENYYAHVNSNVHRGVHYLSNLATDKLEAVRYSVQKFLNARFEHEIIFTKGTTEALNFLANSIANKFMSEGDEIILSEIEHHANIIPWQMVAEKYKLSIKYVKVNEDFSLDLDDLSSKLSSKTKVVSIVGESNLSGMLPDIKEINILVRANSEALLIIDGAQLVPHRKVDVQDLGIDFLVFSGHKMLGPTGIGVVWGKKELLNSLDPIYGGGDMIEEVHYDKATWAPVPHKFEAGTPPYVEAIGLGAAVDYLQDLGMSEVEKHSDELREYGRKVLLDIEGVNVIHSQETIAGCTFGMYVDGVHAADLSLMLDTHGVAVRAGHHCVQPFHRKLGIDATIRSTAYIYNDKEDIDTLKSALISSVEMLR